MKLKNLILLSTLVMLFTMFLGTQSTYAQTTWYVDNLIGNDSYDGKSPVFVAPNSGPRKTITGGVAPGPVGAYQSAVPGDVIYVAYTGTDYSTVTGELDPMVFAKKVTFRTYNSGATIPVSVSANTVVFASDVDINNVSAAPVANPTYVIFDSGNFSVTGGDFKLTAGVLVGGDKITVANASTVTRTNGTILSGQLLFGGNNINFIYNGGNATTGLEFKVAGGTFASLTTNGANPILTIDRSVTMTGVITLNNDLRLGSNTLTVTGNNVGHTTNSNIVGGTLVFNMNGATTLTLSAGANRTVNNITAQSSAGTPTLTLAGVTDVNGNILAQNAASITGAAVDSVYGTVTATQTDKASNITLAAVTVLGGTTNFTGNELVNSGIGYVSVGATKVNGNVLLSTSGIVPAAADDGMARILFTAGAAINIVGNVLNQATFTFPNASIVNTTLAGINGLILFPDVPLTISGDVELFNQFGSSSITGAAKNFKWNGMIVFQNTSAPSNITINGKLTNKSTSNISYGSFPLSTFQDNGLIITPANIDAVIRVDGGIVNSSNFSQAFTGAYTDNGIIDFDYFDAAPLGAATHKTGGTIGINATPGRIGLIENKSVSRAAGDGNGDIYLGPTGAFWGTNVTVSGTAAGGYTIFPNANFNVTGTVLNSRTAGGNCLQVGTAGTAGVTVTITGNLRNTGTSTTTFASSVDALISIGGLLESTANGTITFPNNASAPTTIGTMNISNGTLVQPATAVGGTVSINGNVTMTGGTWNLTATANAPVSVNGTSSTANFYGGVINLSGRLDITLNCLNVGIGNGTSNPDFQNETELTIGTPSPVNMVTVTFGTLQPSFGGTFQVSSGAGIGTSCKLTGGLFKPNVLDLHVGYTNIDGAIIYLQTAGAAFINDAGYYSTNQGRVVMAGAANQTVTTTLANGGQFGDFEVTNTTALPGDAVSMGANLGAFTGSIYLTQGQINNTVNPISFNNPSVYPTIVVNQGKLTAQPVFVSMVNVIYVGIDKVTGNEIPNVGTYPDKLNDLIVATTNGTEGDGKGSVLILQNAIVNGTLTVNAGQNLVIGDNLALTLAGTTANIQGNVTNVGIGGVNYGTLVLGAPAGTNVTATGYLPTVVVANGSINNTITGAKALIDGLLGDDAVVGSHGVFAAPYNVADADYSLAVGGVANGELIYAGATGALNLGMGTSPFTSNNSTHLDGITTVGANNTLTLTANLNEAGTVGINHAAGLISLGNFILNTYDASPFITAGAQITSGTTGLFQFKAANTLLSLLVGDVTIAANTAVNVGAGNTFQIDPTDPGNLIVSGKFYVPSGTIQLGDGATARNLTVTSQTFSVSNGAGFDVIANSLGKVVLNPTTAPLMWIDNNAAPAYTKVQILNDVTLDPAAAVATLNITSNLDLSAGVFDFGAKTVKMNNTSTLTRTGAPGTGSFNTTTATGWLVLDGTTVTTGAGSPSLSVNKLRFLANGSTFTGGAGNFAFTVNSILDMQNTLANTVNTLNGKFTVAANVTVNWSSGAYDAAPNYVKPIILNLVNYIAGGTNLDATVWPTATPDLVGTLTVNGAAAADQVNLPAGTLQVNTANSLYLTRGILNVPAGTTLTLAPGINVYRTNLAQLTVAGSLITDPNYNLFLYANSAAFQTGAELPAVVNNLTLARTTNINNFVITLDKSVTVNGTLDIKNDVTQAAPFILQANGNVNILRDATYGFATLPVVTLASFRLGGVNGQTMTLGGNIQFPNVTVDLQTTVTNPVLNVYGSFTMLPGALNSLTFNNGIINMVDGILYLPRPTGASNSGLGYFVTGTGHVVGNVARPGFANDGQVNDGRFVFPTGTAPDPANARKAYYRPVTLTFTPSYPLGSPTTFVVNHKSVSPEGTKGFENGLDGGAGVTIGKYPNFYWGITAQPAGLSQTQMYDIEMQGSNLGYPYTTYVDLRGIRRLGNSTNNPWLLLTTDGANNSQQIFGTDTTVWVRSTATQGGIVTTESRFTIGIPVIAPGFDIPAVSPTAFAGQENTPMTLPYRVATNLLGGPAPTVSCTVVPDPTGWNLSQNVTLGQVAGDFTWTPTFTQAGTYTVTITATDNGGTSQVVYNVTVADVNRAPVATNVTPATPKVGVPVTITFNATDEDGDAITWNRAFVGTAPSGTVTPAVGPVVGNQYVVTFTPNFNDLAQAYTFQATYTDGKIGAPLTRNVTLAAVTMPQNYGDVNRDGSWTSADAIEALRMSVGLTTSYTTPVFTYDQYNYALADVDLIHNVGNVITTYAPAVYGISAWDAYLILMKSINNATVLPVGTAKTFAASGDLKISKPVAKENGIVAVPLTVDNAKNVYTVTFELNFDTKVAEVVGLANTPKDWLTAYSVENGVVKVVMAGVSPITASNLGELDLRMKNKEARVQISGNATINNLESRTLATMTVGQVPTNFALEQNFPNPFNPSTTIKYQIAEPTKVAISIYSIDGQLVNTLVNEAKDAGYYQVVWNGTNSYGKQVASGMYIYRIDAGNFVSTKKLMLMK